MIWWVPAVDLERGGWLESSGTVVHCSCPGTDPQIVPHFQPNRIINIPMAENSKTQRFNGHQNYPTIQFTASRAGTLLRLLVSRTSPETTNLWSSSKYWSRIWWFSREDLWFVVSCAISNLWLHQKRVILYGKTRLLETRIYFVESGVLDSLPSLCGEPTAPRKFFQFRHRKPLPREMQSSC
jgi:hypothetical protein